MSKIPELLSERLRLRGWRPSDVEALRRIYGDPQTMRFIGDGSTMPPDRAWHAVAALLGHWELRGYGMWAVTERSTGEVLGRVGLYHPEGWPGIELGWLLDRSRWGEGLATEAARLAAAWAWETLELDRLIHLIQPDNLASVRIAQKLGASLDHRLNLDGVDVDVYALARPTASPAATKRGPSR
ncbi:GNAT family N-acetyltransferase [Egicoccus sp. AB-alg2]|uniref:GNAT family N-acetyltransferase n=1 Tax=Egicoccus sp. AB-alg2 TaxID=3242693 RepID=UPI00359EEEE1